MLKLCSCAAQPVAPGSGPWTCFIRHSLQVKKYKKLIMHDGNFMRELNFHWTINNFTISSLLSIPLQLRSSPPAFPLSVSPSSADYLFPLGNSFTGLLIWKDQAGQTMTRPEIAYVGRPQKVLCIAYSCRLTGIGASYGDNLTLGLL